VRTVLASTPKNITSGTPYRLQLIIRETNPVRIEGWIDGTQVISFSDSSSSRIQSSGVAGFTSSTGALTTFDDLEFSEPEPIEGPSSGTILASDDFSSCADDAGPSSSLWETSGTWYCRAQRLRGETATGLALLPGLSATNAKMRSRVQPTASTADRSGVVVRAGNGSYYAARLNFTSQTVVLDRVDSQGTTTLASVPYSLSVGPSYRVELTSYGWNPVRLTVAIEGVNQFTVDDESADRLQGATVGLLSGTSVRTAFDDVIVYSQ
jgi:hypothetical protein